MTVIALAGVALLIAVIVVGLFTVFDVSAITDQLDPFTSPSLEDVIYAGVIATVAFAGIEAAANLAPDIETEAVGLRKLVVVAATLVPVIYFGVSVIALMAVPVVPTPNGPETALGSTYLENPVLGVVQSFHPAWVSDVMEVAVVAIVPVALIWAANTAMLGLSRHAYVLATNRQIPSWLGKLNRRFRTPHVTIAIAAVFAFGLVVPTDIAARGPVRVRGDDRVHDRARVGDQAAHRRTRPPRPFRIPFDVTIAGRADAPAGPAAAALSALAWVSVIVYHDSARWVGAGWMIFGLVSLRDLPQGGRGHDPDRAGRGPGGGAGKAGSRGRVRRHPRPGLRHQARRRHRRDRGPARRRRRDARRVAPKIEVIYVVDVPLTVPLDSPPPADRAEQANGPWRAPRRSGRSTTRSRSSCRWSGRPLGRLWDRGGGARPRRRDDRDGRRAAEPDQGGAVLGGIGGVAARGDRAGDRVRAAPGRVPGCGDRSGGDGSRRTAGSPELAPTGDRREGSLPAPNAGAPGA